MANNELRAMSGRASNTARSKLVAHSSSLFSQRRHIDHESISHIALEHALVGFVNFLNRHYFNVARHSVLGAEIQHLLRFADPSNLRSCHTASSRRERERSKRYVFLGQPDNH